MGSLADKIDILLHQHTLTRQDVIEINERIIQAYLDQTEREMGSDDDAVSVHSDSEGDHIDFEGNIYDENTEILIGKKNLKTKKKKMFNVV